MKIVQQLIHQGHHVYITGISALERYAGADCSGVVNIATDADIVALSSLFDEVSFPSIEDADILIKDRREGLAYYVKSLEHHNRLYGRLRHTTFWFDCTKKSYKDPYGIYWDLRNPGILEIPEYSSHRKLHSWHLIGDAAILVSRFRFTLDEAGFDQLVTFAQADAPLMSASEQQMLLMRVLDSAYPAKGLRLLMDCGFIRRHWNVLAAMKGVEQSKEYHPEGDVWEHTLQTFSHVKERDTAVLLALLLHDTGKAFAAPKGKNTFDQHAQIGSRKAGQFLRSLGFSQGLVDDVEFLVRNHMLPSLLVQLPVYRLERSINSPLFPQLLEVFRCDVSSTFRGLDTYYHACEIYRKYLRHKKNPYRNSDGTRRLQYG